MISSKKADMKLIRQIVLMVILVVISLYLINEYVVKPMKPADCRGECVDEGQCYLPSTVMPGKCSNNQVCCVNQDDLDKENESTTNPNINPDVEVSQNCNVTSFPIYYLNGERGAERARCEGSNAVICNINQDREIETINSCELNEDHMVYRVCCSQEQVIKEPAQILDLTIGETRSKLATYNLEVGKTYNIYVTSIGDDVESCWIYTSNRMTGDIIRTEGVGINETISGNCDDVHIQITPKLNEFRETEEFNLGIVLKNQSEVLRNQDFLFRIINTLS